MKQDQISPLQAVMLLVNTIISTSIIFLPGAPALRDAWLATIGGLVVALVITWVVTTLGRLFPEQTIINYPETIMGRYAGKFFGALFLIFFVYLAALTLWDFGVFTGTSLLNQTPVPVINTIGITITIYAVRHGLGTIARVVQFFLPVLLLSLTVAIILVATMPDNNWANLLPVLDKGIKPVIAGTLGAADWLGEIFFLAMLWPFITPKNTALPAALGGLAIAGMFLLIIAVVVIAVYSDFYATMLYPFYSAILMTEIFQVIRLDILIITVWVMGVFLKLSFLLYITSLGLAQWLGLKEYKPLILPVAVIFLSLASLPFIESTSQYPTINMIISMYALCIQLVVPALLLVVASIRRR